MILHLHFVWQYYLCNKSTVLVLAPFFKQLQLYRYLKLEGHESTKASAWGFSMYQLLPSDLLIPQMEVTYNSPLKRSLFKTPFQRSVGRTWYLTPTMRFDHQAVWHHPAAPFGSSRAWRQVRRWKQIPCDKRPIFACDKEHPIFQFFIGWENPDVHVSFLLGMVYIMFKETQEIEIQSVFVRDHYDEEFPGITVSLPNMFEARESV